ncbi:hypothetical protein [Autumnicola edwardsiae]|jgi:hypothetical protein|uniref:Lipoprotein n=1 Tax=Autumnicola edwardsiae TaxID=3075594 RepID=A0ABU3CUQ2_9FLAO|nr:hypothetical protein [Zunongwangia sp. F297]MDT0650093.1 hypothetical protein [Zunongwangia sp. F297]
MKKLLWYGCITALLFLTSCHVPSYTFDPRSTRAAIKFEEGKYLLNNIKAPESIRQKLEEMVTEEISQYLQKDITLVRNAGGVFIPFTIPENPDAAFLKSLKTGISGYDYLVNVRTEILSDDIEDMEVGNIQNSEENLVSVSLEIFDLKSAQSIYFQKVSGHLSAKDDSKDFSFAKSSKSMVVKSLKKILKRIEKNHLP